MADSPKQAALRRKAQAMELAGGDPVKIAELRAQLPVERATAPRVTAEPSKPVETAATDATAPDADRLGDPVKTPRMAATRGPGRPPKAAATA